MGLSKIFAAVLAVTSIVAAIPEPIPEYPEIIPGPGMPSLEELGLTNADLYEMTPNLASRDAALKATCFNPGKPRCTIRDAQACVNYLTAKGNNACYVRQRSFFCQTTTGCFIRGNNVGNKPSTTSSCYNVGQGAQKIIDSCQGPNGRTQGTQNAIGNAALKITIQARE